MFTTEAVLFGEAKCFCLVTVQIVMRIIISHMGNVVS